VVENCGGDEVGGVVDEANKLGIVCMGVSDAKDVLLAVLGGAEGSEDVQMNPLVVFCDLAFIEVEVGPKVREGPGGSALAKLSQMVGRVSINPHPVLIF